MDSSTFLRRLLELSGVVSSAAYVLLIYEWECNLLTETASTKLPNLCQNRLLNPKLTRNCQKRVCMALVRKVFGTAEKASPFPEGRHIGMG